MRQRKNFANATSLPVSIHPVPKELPDTLKVISFGRTALTTRSFNFGLWQNKGIDAIALLLQGMAEQLLASRARQPTSVVSLCSSGATNFLNFCAEQSKAVGRDLLVNDIDRAFIDHYIAWLGRQFKTDGTELISYVTQKTNYVKTKSLLVEACKLGLLPERANLFPTNPYPGSSRHYKGEKPLSKSERKRFAQALQHDLTKIAKGEFEGTEGHALALICLLISLRTGLNTTPLLELSRDALQPHPLKPNWRLLVSYKRRSSTTHIQALRWSERISATASAQTDVVGWYEWARERTRGLPMEAPPGMVDRLWLYRVGGKHEVTALSLDNISDVASRFVKRHGLVSDDGSSLKLTISRLRTTYVNRLYELSGFDAIVSARLAGHTVQVSGDHYLTVSPEAEKEFHFAGITLVDALRTRKASATNESAIAPTPVGRCDDPVNGEFAPKKNGKLCIDFLSCFQCKNMVVTGDDLWRLFSFYYLLVGERSIMNAPA